MMTALAIHQQIDNHGRSGMGWGTRSVRAAGCRGYRPAGVGAPRRQGDDLPNSGRGFGSGRFLRVGWCFNTARDFLEFHALTRAGIRPDHAVALIAQSLPNQSACEAAVVPEVHSSVPSKGHVLDDRDRDTK